jgi:predicted enzyme related to lactoylglutathione lyase
MAEFASYAHGTPCWVDVTSAELDRSVAFYRDLFGWEAEADSRPEAGGYTMFTLRGRHVAAASPPPPGQESVPSHWTTYLASDDVDATAATVQEAGGTLLMEPFDVFEAGRMTVAQDPTGAVFGVWQAGEHIGAQLANEPGTLNWNECRTTDPEAAGAFYERVFGHEIDVQSIGEGQEYRVVKVGGRGVAGIAELGPRLQGMPPHWSTVFTVADTDESVARAEELGGERLAEPVDIPEVGRFAVVRDPVGAAFGVLSLDAGTAP